MPTKEEKIQEFLLQDKENKRYLAHHGWTTQKKYAKRFIKEDAEEQMKRAALNGGFLTMIPDGDDA